MAHVQRIVYGAPHVDVQESCIEFEEVISPTVRTQYHVRPAIYKYISPS